MITLQTLFQGPTLMDPAVADSIVMAPILDTLMTERILATESKLDSILVHISEISNNISAIDFWEFIAILASVVTIAGFITIYGFFRKRTLNNKRRKSVVLDLTRHFFMTNSIAESIILKLYETDEKRPHEGVISMFATLDDDLNLNRFTNSVDYYDDVHRICEHIRNYNSIAHMADRKCADPSYPKHKIRKDMEDLVKRSITISEELIDICNVLHWRQQWKIFWLNFPMTIFSDNKILLDEKYIKGLRESGGYITYSQVEKKINDSYGNKALYIQHEKELMKHSKQDLSFYFDKKKCNLKRTYEVMIEYNLQRIRFYEK